MSIHRQGVDRFGRTLATVSVNGRDVGTSLVENGLARWRRGSACCAEAQVLMVGTIVAAGIIWLVR